MSSSVYAEKIYPDIPSAPPENDQTYRLAKIDEMEKFLRSEIHERDMLTKRFKRRATVTTISDNSIVTAITTLEIVGIVSLTTGVGIPLAIAFTGAGLTLGIGSGIVHKVQRIFDSKAKKHDKIKVLAESKLDSISGLVSKAIADGTVSHDEYQFILKEIENYRQLKQEIRTKSKKTVDTITAEQREEILAQGREEGRKAFLAKIAASSDIPTARVT